MRTLINAWILKDINVAKVIYCAALCVISAWPQNTPAMVVMNYGADGNDYYQFTNPSMAFDKASGFTTLITFGIHVNPDGTLMIGGSACATNGVYVGPSNWGSLVTTLKTPPTTVNRYEVLIGGWEDTSYNNIESLVNSQGTGPGSILYKNFLALKNAVPGIDAINDDDELTYDLGSSTSFANMLGALGYKFTLVPYTYQSFWVQLKHDITNCDYVYLQCYEGGAGNDPGNWNVAFGGTSGYSLSGFHVIPGQESNTANPTNWTDWYLETGGQGGFYYPDIVFNTTNWSAAILNSASQAPLIGLTNNDSGGSSFNTAGNWANGGVPSSTNGYVDSGYTLNAPSSGSYMFLGNSLLINNGGALSFNNASGDILTFGTNAMTGLTLDYGASAEILNGGSDDTIAGYLNLGPDGGGNLVPGSGVLTVSAVIGGTGFLTVPSGNSGVAVLSAANNFSGNVIVNNGATLQLQNPQSLAASSVTLNSGATLQLRSDNNTTFLGGDNLQGLGNATLTLDVDQLTGLGVAQTIGFASHGFNVGNSTLNFTGSHGYALSLGSLTGVYAGPLTLNAATANAYITSVSGGANITQLVKNGADTVFLSGASSYVGGTTVNAGVLDFQAGASGASSSLQVAGGAACRVESSFPVLAGSASVSINANGHLYLANGVNLAVSNLVLGGASQAAGSWGSSSSTAANKNNAYFSGPGVLWAGVPPPPPAAPTGLNATPGNEQAVLNWAISSGATGYNVKRSTTSGSEVTIANVTANAFTDSNLTNGTTYYYEVSATNSGGESANSTQVSVLPEPAVSLTNSDAFGVTSFNTAGNWSSGRSPSSGSDYVDNGYTIRTPSSGNATFSGNCLEISNGVFGFKTSSGSTITVGSSAATALFLNNSFVSLFDSGRTESLSGFIVLNAGGGSFSPNTGALPIISQISGSGALAVVGNASPATVQNGIVTLSGVNSYTGGTILDTADMIRLFGFGTLGANTGSFTFTDSSNLVSTETLDLNGTSQTIGNLSGVSSARIINGASAASRLTIGNGGNGGGDFAGSVSTGGGVLSLIKTGAGTITLSGTNTYTGPTLINGGTLALSGAGLMSGTPVITIASGATFDVSGLTTTLSLSAGQTLAGTGATGTVNGNLNLGSGALALNYSSGTPTLSVSGGNLAMNNNAVVVTNTGTALPVGSYKIVSKGAGGSVSGAVSASTVSVAGGGVAAGTRAGLSITGGELYLTVTTGSGPIISSSYNGTVLTLSWSGGGNLLQATNLPGPWTTNTGATSPFTVTPATNGPQTFYRVQQ